MDGRSVGAAHARQQACVDVGQREPEGQGFGGNLPGAWGGNVLEVAGGPLSLR